MSDFPLTLVVINYFILSLVFIFSELDMIIEVKNTLIFAICFRIFTIISFYGKDIMFMPEIIIFNLSNLYVTYCCIVLISNIIEFFNLKNKRLYIK